MYVPALMGLLAFAHAAPVDPDPSVTLPRHELSSASEVGLNRTGLSRAEEAVWDEINRGSFPGASLAVGRWGHVVMEEGLGRTGSGEGAVDPDRTVYDLASLSKVVGTTTAVMWLVEHEKMSLDDPVRERFGIGVATTGETGMPQLLLKRELGLVLVAADR